MQNYRNNRITELKQHRMGDVQTEEAKHYIEIMQGRLSDILSAALFLYKV